MRERGCFDLLIPGLQPLGLGLDSASREMPMFSISNPPPRPSLARGLSSVLPALPGGNPASEQP